MPAPLGNQNAAKAKRWEAAICRALSSWPNEPDSTDCSDLIRGLNQAAHRFVANMMHADEVSFFRELGDRIDGKPAQAMEHSGPGGKELRLIAPWMSPNVGERNG